MAIKTLIHFKALFLKKYFIHLFKRERERENKQRGWAEAEGQADSVLNAELDVGLDPTTLENMTCDEIKSQTHIDWATQATQHPYILIGTFIGQTIY